MKRRQAAGFSLSETRYTKGLKLSPHSHEAPYFCFILCGANTESYGGRLRDQEFCAPDAVSHYYQRRE